MPNDFDCQQLEPLLSAYSDGELSDKERNLADAHLNKCPACQSKLIEIRAVAGALKSLPRLDSRVDVAANIEQLIASQPRKFDSNRKQMIWGSVGVAAAAAVTLVVVNQKNFSPVSSTQVAQTSQTSTSAPAISKSKPSTKPNTGVVAETLKSHDNAVETRVAEAKPESLQRNPDAGQPGKKEVVPRNRNESELIKNSKFNPRAQLATADGVRAGSENNGFPDTKSGADHAASAVQVTGAATTSAPFTDQSIVAVYDTGERGVTEELGITTDEDGLYAIKL